MCVCWVAVAIRIKAYSRPTDAKLLNYETAIAHSHLDLAYVKNLRLCTNPPLRNPHGGGAFFINLFYAP